MSQSWDLRECRLYRFYGWDPRTNYTTKTLIYIGETVRQPFERLMEHVGDKPWADTITSWEVDDRVFAGKGEVLAAEVAAIRSEQPLYNYEGNLANPHRVEIWRQEKQRHARDDAAGRRRWVKPVPRQRASSVRTAPTVPVRRGSVSRKWTPVQVKASLWLITWVSTTAVMWGEAARLGLFATWAGNAVFGAAEFVKIGETSGC
jgi:hypothetical protein